MHAFTDSEDRTWEIRINVTQQVKVKEKTGVNLYPELVQDGGKPLGELLMDLEKLVQVLYTLCEKQCEEKGVTPEGFGEGLSGESLEKATNAFLEELLFFIPNQRAAASLRRVLEKMKQASGLLLEDADNQLNRIDMDKWIKKMKKEMGVEDIDETLLRRSSGKSPGKSASTPDRER